jgi:hypothetical protein
VSDALTYAHASSPKDGQWWLTEEDHCSVEATYQATGRCRFPWQWCGETILFQNWKEFVIRRDIARRQLRVGMNVSFIHNGTQKTGVVSRINRKTVTVIGETGRYLVGATLLKIE